MWLDSFYICKMFKVKLLIKKPEYIYKRSQGSPNYSHTRAKLLSRSQVASFQLLSKNGAWHLRLKCILEARSCGHMPLGIQVERNLYKHAITFLLQRHSRSTALSATEFGMFVFISCRNVNDNPMIRDRNKFLDSYVPCWYHRWFETKLNHFFI